MPFDAAAILRFFTDVDHIGLDEPMRLKVVEQGITSVDSLGGFDEEDWDYVYKSVSISVPGATRNNPSSTRKLPAMSLTRLKVASEAVRYYKCINRPLEPPMMHWTVLQAFREEWKALTDRKAMNPSEIPKLTKNTTVIKWAESFETLLRNTIGVRNIPLIYVIRKDVVPPAAAPPLLANQPFSDETGSVSEELVVRATHSHPKFKDDSTKVFQYLDEALQGSAYVGAISKFRKHGDGRGAYLAITSQYGGKDRWYLVKEKALSDLRDSTWNGTGTVTVSSFILKHRNAFTDLESCKDHVDVEVPTDRGRVEYLLKAVSGCSDMTFKAMVAQIEASDGDPAGAYSSFERTAELLLKVCPIARKGKEKRLKNKEVHFVEGDIAIKSLATEIKKGPKTGVDIRYYKPGEFAKLSKDQKKELKECKEKNKKRTAGGDTKSDPDKGKDSDRKKLRKEIKSILKEDAKALADQEKQMREIASLFLSPAAASNPAQVAEVEAKVQALSKLLKTKKDSGSGE